MIFNSVVFFIFLPIVFLLYWYIFNRKLSYQNAFLLIASYFFYGWWNWRFLGLLFLSTLIDYTFGFLVDKHYDKKRKLFLIICLANNLLVLAIFKYFNFFITEFQELFRVVGIQNNLTILNIALPVGISFYTFHGMSYAIDIYRRKIKPVNSFIDYSLFVSFFPLLVAGPIERATHLLPQIQTPRNFRYDNAVAGLRLILYGLIKKIIIADTLAISVNDIFTNYKIYSGSTLMLGAVYFSIQIYCDFSGYSDIAIGTGKLFGFELFNNFNFPYFSKNIGEFWKRWHISLSSWFRDYVYFPLGGSKISKYISIRNIFIVFLLSGFWHGANLTFIFWGLIHASLYIPLFLNKNYTTTDTNVINRNKFYDVVKVLFTFFCVTIAWIFFRSENIPKAFDYIGRFTIGFFDRPLYVKNIIYVILIMTIELIIYKNWLRFNKFKFKLPFYAILTIILLYYFITNKGGEFIYFQF
jgi:D-alanyl-lipoteichoic acid acyltransferase DltB (MBOAT superfamily)